MDSEGVADLLREWKERSGLSYGSLARQAHMSPSTVHRYCNSDAVPTEFAPVEKIARLCGASREELLRLHRRWIVADEARRRAKNATGTEPLSATASPAREAEPHPEAAQHPEAAPTPEAGPRPDPDPAPEPGTASDASPVSGLDDRAPEVAPDRTRPRLPARRPRRLLLPLGAAVATVLVAGLGAFALWPGERDLPLAHGPAGNPTAPTNPGRTFGTPSASAPTAGTPSSTGTAPAPAAPDAGRATRTPPGGSGAGADGDSAPGRQRPRVPLAADVNPYVWKDPCSQVYVVDREPGKMPPPPTEQDARGWVTSLSGVPGGEMVIDVALQGLGDETVILKALHVRTVAVSEPLPGNAYVMGVGCGGEARLQSMDVNLDAPRPRPVPVAGYRGDRFVPASDFPYTVSASDPQILRITAHTRSRHVRWYLEMEWSSGGRNGVLRLDDGGRPFTTSSATGLPTWQQAPGESAWGPYQRG
ncbi:helix-turn-helix domain-containing protein [Streptomyces sp. NPDC008121]|uniref:transcriptional regulator n=1 Tax=Streptomyces sp. NPDC008121 TaxID=3364809 RepID=UPI0036EA008D